MLRLYDPDQGEILIGGVNIRNCQGAELRRGSGWCRRTRLFSGRIFGKICAWLGPEAKDADVRRACELANAWEYISRLPDGLETPVGRRRIDVVGRAAAAAGDLAGAAGGSGVLHLRRSDDALDTVSEKLVQEAMENAVDGKDRR